MSLLPRTQQSEDTHSPQKHVLGSGTEDFRRQQAAAPLRAPLPGGAGRVAPRPLPSVRHGFKLHSIGWVLNLSALWKLKLSHL